MRSLLRVSAFILVGLCWSANAQSPSLLPAGTTVHLQILDVPENNDDSEFVFLATTDVKIGKTIAIPKGAVLFGKVVESGPVGQSSEFEILLTHSLSDSGQRVPLQRQIPLRLPKAQAPSRNAA